MLLGVFSTEVWKLGVCGHFFWSPAQNSWLASGYGARGASLRRMLCQGKLCVVGTRRMVSGTTATLAVSEQRAGGAGLVAQGSNLCP